MVSRASDDDSRSSHLFTDPWNGSRSPLFRIFKRDFKTGADGLFLPEDDYSIWQALEDTDQGGNAQGADALYLLKAKLDMLMQ